MTCTYGFPTFSLSKFLSNKPNKTYADVFKRTIATFTKWQLSSIFLQSDAIKIWHMRFRNSRSNVALRWDKDNQGVIAISILISQLMKKLRWWERWEGANWRTSRSTFLIFRENSVGFGEVDRKDGAPRVLLPLFDFISCELYFCHSSSSKRTPECFWRFIRNWFRVSKQDDKNPVVMPRNRIYLTLWVDISDSF